MFLYHSCCTRVAHAFSHLSHLFYNSFNQPPLLSSKTHCLGPLALAKLLPHEDFLIAVIQWQREPGFECAENMCHCFSGQTERQSAPGGAVIMKIRPPASTTTSTFTPSLSLCRGHYRQQVCIPPLLHRRRLDWALKLRT